MTSPLFFDTLLNEADFRFVFAILKEFEHMIYDPIRLTAEKRSQRRFDWTFFVCLAVLCVICVFMFLKQAAIQLVDFSVHMNWAGDFDFSDLHSITSRIAYPMWHILVAIVHQLGLPLEWAAVLITTLCKMGTYVLAYLFIDAMSLRSQKRWLVSLMSFAAVIVTCLWIRPVSYFVYKGVGSPNVWHNPTQLAVTFAMFIVIPWLLHLWYEFERGLTEGRTNIILPWWKIIVMIVINMGCLSCKPTVLQALMPAAFVMYLVELIRHKSEWRYFGQIVLAFVPAAAYFLLQYLYYTGVVVEFTSGVEFGITGRTAWLAVRNTLMMSACPLMAVIACWRKGMLKDRSLVLALLMTLFSVIEVMAFRETGMREGHGNFAWASYSSSMYLWVVMIGVFLRSFTADVKQGMTLVRKTGYGLTFALFGWHLVSGIYYLFYLFSREMAF